jgi:hypothetical protein
MEKENQGLEPQIHICPVCGRKAEYYSVYEVIQDCPCVQCQLKQLNERKQK